MKLSKLSIPYRAVSKFSTILVFVLLFGGASMAAESPLGALIVFLFVLTGFSVTAVYEYFYWRNYNYEITEEGLEIVSGVFSRKTRDIPLRRIQNVDVQRTLLQRVFGLAKVHVETAGGDNTEANFRYVEAEKAEDIQKQIRELKNRRTDSEEEKKDKDDFILSDKNLTVLSLVSVRPRTIFSYLVLAGIAAGVMGPQTGSGITGILGSVLLVFLIVSVVMFFWLSGAVSTFITFYDFRLAFRDNALEYERGLLHRSSGTIPEEKIQNLIIEENFLKRLLGYATLKVETAGYGPEQELQGSETAIPLAKKEEIVKMAEEIGEVKLPEEFEPITPRAKTRYFRRYVLLSLVLFGVAVPLNILAGITPFIYAVPLTVLVASKKAAQLKWENIGYALKQDHVFTRKGFWSRKTYSVPYFRIQNLIRIQTVFQKRWKMETVTIDTAGSALTNPSIPDIEEEESPIRVLELFERFKNSL